MFAAVKSLPDLIARNLKQLGYARADIAITARESFDVFDAGSTGRRAFAVVLNLKTGESEQITGSWGGANAFTTNAVDSDTKKRPLPEGFILIKGSEGYGGVFASLYANPKNLNTLLPQDTTNVSDTEKKALELFRLKSGYRADEARRIGIRYDVTNPVFQSLIAKGYVKANKAGSMQITTEGKNAR